jgi:hypothetical protein
MWAKAALSASLGPNVKSRSRLVMKVETSLVPILLVADDDGDETVQNLGVLL